MARPPSPQPPAVCPRPDAQAGARAARTEGGEAAARHDPGRVPVPLACLVAAALLLGVGWAFTTPAFQAPDEQYHFAYVQSLGERGSLPGAPGQRPISAEQLSGAATLNADQVAAQRDVPPEWSPSAQARWDELGPGFDRADGGGPNPAAANPPVAYLWALLGYEIAAGDDLFARLTAARLLCVLWLGVTVLGTWLLAGELFGGRRPAQLAAAAVPALLPMVGFVSASLSPDALLYALWSLALWLGVRCLRRPPGRGGLAALFAVVGLACTVKAVSYALLPGAGLVLAVVLWRSRTAPRSAAGLLVAALVPLAATLGAWFAVARGLDRAAAAQVATVAGPGGTNWRALASYLWSYYLPRAPGQGAAHPSGGYPAYEVWLKHGWAAFGWLEVRFTENVYRVLALLTAGVGGLALVSVCRRRRRLDRPVLGFLVLTLLTLLAGLHWTDYHQIAGGSLGFMQGRYLFPVVALAGVALAAAVELLPPARRLAAVGAALAGLLVLDLLALGLVWQRFYA